MGKSIQMLDLLRRMAPAWMDDGLCADHPDPELWFPVSKASDAAADARAVCVSCPVIGACGIYAVAHGIGYGVWAGHRMDVQRENKRLRARYDPNYRPPAPPKPDARGVCARCGQESLQRNLSGDPPRCRGCARGHTPIGIVHAHMQTLIDAQWTLRAIADAAGLDRSTVRNIWHTKTGHVTPANADAIRAVGPTQAAAS
ncbi:WhiB family transcriptional regulator [Nocardia sp. SC052]|uniref:WhiB family transcriptional regulator n=1 Tax=Nocardia sichangensis TaxID=3385975 RepID=UPI0039A3B6DF